MDNKDSLTASLEDYLETIYHIIEEKQAARPVDIARKLNVKNSSVTGALRSLAKKNLVNYSPYDIVTLTKKGSKIAKEVVKKHKVLRDFFIKVLSIDYKEADEAACEIEHCISKNIFERFVSFINFVEECPRAGSTWIEGFGYYCKHDDKPEDCEKCMNKSANISPNNDTRNDKK